MEPATLCRGSGRTVDSEGSPNRIKQKQMMDGTATAYELAKKYGIRTAFGTDNLFSASNAAKQGAM